MNNRLFIITVIQIVNIKYNFKKIRDYSVAICHRLNIIRSDINLKFYIFIYYKIYITVIGYSYHTYNNNKNIKLC
jgi:hypothetical protein